MVSPSCCLRPPPPLEDQGCGKKIPGLTALPKSKIAVTMQARNRYGDGGG